ncbi:uncharacterized protein THITE_159801 [Thermothielavioides terrestris NRRL 8126]|uniref:Uncharacterized protein n=1 Tax=Thermothielavioides terrestris (strain ATCC 38088 / NRRL 8126) TaxID=578455 RepID=G2R6U2_THETT|nr:uncharacterized protein THITE_159801 [Thermothielavioides terrestris NRRL 8126]AEO68520.1 hypothetical protein THITE_159801 [Thermothielavioides terrestris NRRL 8126]
MDLKRVKWVCRDFWETLKKTGGGGSGGTVSVKLGRWRDQTEPEKRGEPGPGEKPKLGSRRNRRKWSMQLGSRARRGPGPGPGPGAEGQAAPGTRATSANPQKVLNTDLRCACDPGQPASAEQHIVLPSAPHVLH